MMLRKKLFGLIIGLTTIIGINTAYASMTIPMYLTSEDGKGQDIGTVKVEDSTCGVLITPNLHNLPPGLHGFHIHEKPDCSQKGMAAGNHLDPDKTGKHEGPYSEHGHLGDLPVLIVDADGTATLPTLAPRFKLADLKNHALMIHAGSDNYSDQPVKNGGGGDRIACGVIGSES